MKPALSVLLALMTALSFKAIADEAPVIVTPSGSVKPVNNNDIKMVRETIDIYLFAGYYKVEVNYEFLNTGRDQNVTMGFPKGDFMDFKAYVGGAKQNIINRKGEWRYKFNGFVIEAMESYSGSNGPAPIQSFECFDTRFEAGETKKVKNTYSQKYSGSYSGGLNGAFYILTTGALWKDDIDEIVIRLHNQNIPRYFTDKFYFNNEMDNPYSHKESFEKVYKDIEPQDDISFAFPEILYPLTSGAQSTLEPYKNISYSSGNLQDGDINTAWVEGEKGYGEGISVYYLSSHDCRGEEEGDADNFTAEISAIHIVNGYAKSESAFKNNSRVKELEITARHRENTVKSIRLKDTPEEQVFTFDPPLRAFCGELNLKIISVYKGDKWADTALTEVWFELVGK